ncbi:MAG: BolA/IbaG family iron-sulfur metabolism protein [Myxococcaceae bacterium]|nr:BolA/IbaG family iron-sulfur metabolism protein [Myxococcaceae bacterium]
MLDPTTIARRIEAALPGAQVTVRDLTGTGDHFEAQVVSAAFQGKSMVEQHQTVYAPLKDVLATGELHALALKTYTPEQWDRRAAKKAP